MDDSEFAGSLVLEKLAEIGQLDVFFAAVDADDFAQVKTLLQKAHVDRETIAVVLQKMRDSET